MARNEPDPHGTVGAPTPRWWQATCPQGRGSRSALADAAVGTIGLPPSDNPRRPPAPSLLPHPPGSPAPAPCSRPTGWPPPPPAPRHWPRRPTRSPPIPCPRAPARGPPANVPQHRPRTRSHRSRRGPRRTPRCTSAIDSNTAPPRTATPAPDRPTTRTDSRSSPQGPRTLTRYPTAATSCSLDNPSRFCRYGRIDGSMSPERVAITSPSSGENPMELSTGRP